MATFTKDQEHYIEHEVQLRVHDAKFYAFEKSIERLDNKIDKSVEALNASIKHIDGKLDNQFKWFAGMFVSAVIIPIVLHFIRAV